MPRSVTRSRVRSRPRVVVVGAGAFGGWTALELVRRGAEVTLIDAWGPGNARASSGGETRIIRATYGARRVYTHMATRALALWRGHDRKFGAGLLHQTGALWLFEGKNDFARDSLKELRAARVRIETLSPSTARKRYPQVNFDGISSAFFEPDAGYLLARRACEHVAERVVAESGAYRQAAIEGPLRLEDGPLETLTLVGGESHAADAFVLACGPWLGTLLPDVVGSAITPTRQEVFYFGTPAGDTRFADSRLPVWLNFGPTLVYGIPGGGGRAFKLADDTPGPTFEPTIGNRTPSAVGVAAARTFLARRFPALGDAPCLGAEVCQYEATADSDFIIDRHPRAPNVWIAGGGSGHGFKMGPAIGEMVASLVLGTREPDPQFSLARQTMASRKWGPQPTSAPRNP